jgi:misacylated tRNA(Ala) deacylase
LTEKLYWRDAYLREFDASVVSVDGNTVVLDQTAFYPRGGGLTSDTGLLGGARVVEASYNHEGSIAHVLERPPSFSAGEVVHGVLDWDKRYRIMKMHTTAHILSAVVSRETGALITGNQLTPDQGRMDLSLEQFDRDKLAYYVEEVNAIVGRGLEVKSYFMKKEEAMKIAGLVKLASAAPPSLDVLRIVQIGDVDTQADGGVHVKNTSEIGKVVGLRAENKGKSNRRLYFTISPGAL